MGKRRRNLERIGTQAKAKLRRVLEKYWDIDIIGIFVSRS